MELRDIPLRYRLRVKQRLNVLETGGRSIGEIARDIDLTESALRLWVRKRRSMPGGVSPDYLQVCLPQLRGPRDSRRAAGDGVLSAGVDILSKPFSHGALAGKVRDMLDT